MYQSNEAIILKHRRFSESSLLVTMFTRDFGRVEALAKGARRKSSPMKGHFDLFTREEVVIFHRQRAGLDLGVEASLISEHENIRRSPRAFAAAGIIADLLCSGNMVRDPHEKSYFAAANALADFDQALKNGTGINPDLMKVILAILADYGFMPGLEKCMGCGEKAPRHPALSGNHGGIICRNCSDEGIELTAGELSILRHCATDSAARISLAGCGDNGINILAALAGYCRHMIEKPVRSFNVFFELNLPVRGSRT